VESTLGQTDRRYSEKSHKVGPLHGIKNWKYDARLKFLGIARLDKRRIRSDLVETFKVLNGFYNINKGLFFDLDDGGHRGHEKKLFKSRFCLDTMKFVFSNRVVDNRNSLSAPLTQFKKHVSV